MKSSVLSFGVVIALLFTGCSKMILNRPADSLLVPDKSTLSLTNQNAPKLIDGAYIVVFKETVSDVDAVVEEISKKHRFKSKHRFKHSIKGFSGKLTPQTVQDLKSDPRVKYVEQDQIVSIENTPIYTNSWGLDRTDQRTLPLDAAYNYQHTGSSVDAYIFDTGIRLSHADFGGRAMMGFDAYPWETASTDGNGHGTHVAGTVGGKVYGIAKGVRLIAVRVLGKDGTGSWSDVAAGIDWVTNHHGSNLAVANFSLGGGPSQFVEDALRQAVADGITVCVAAMNAGADADNYSPARVREAITVGASDINDSYASFSNYGTAVDIFAPGVNIPSASHMSDQSVVSMSGTSMSAPHVTGVAALYISTHPAATPAEVEAAIKANGTVNRLSGLPAGTNNLLLNVDFSNPPPPSIPFAASLKMPANYSNQVATSPILSWYTSTGCASYTMQISKYPDFRSIAFNVSDVTNTSISGLQLEGNTVYYWRVNASNQVGTSEWSSVWTFTTSSGSTASETPVAVTPFNGAVKIVTPTTFSWNAGNGARSYRLQISTNASFTNVVYKLSDINGTSVVVKGLLPGTQYYWRVSANYVYTMSPWSVYSGFTTM